MNKSNHRSPFAIVGRLIVLVKPMLPVMLAAIVMGVAGHFCATFITIFGGFGILRALGLASPLRSVGVAFACILVFALLRGILRYAEQASNHYIAFKLLALIRDKVFGALRRLTPAKLEGRDRGDLISLITADIEALEVFYAHTISPVCIAVLWAAGMTAFTAHWHILPALALLLGVAAACCLLFSWRGARRLQTIAAGLATVADGGTIRLPTDGFAGELADTVNRTSEQLRRRNEIIARRDDARTSWIAGVSHDVRTPLALILGWAEQLEQDTALPAAARQKACGIRTQSEKLRALIEDLNLTSKLEYGTQPLRKQEFAAGPLFRELVAQFCESPQAESCEVSLQQTAAAEQAKLCVDRALLERLLENLLGNSIRHNAAPVEIEVQTDVAGNRFCLTVADNGTGYPHAVLAALQGMPQNEQTPHILGLHVVEQIAAAHGGRVTFGQNAPNGAKATVWLPCAEKKAPVAFGQNVVK